MPPHRGQLKAWRKEDETHPVHNRPLSFSKPIGVLALALQPFRYGTKHHYSAQSGGS